MPSAVVPPSANGITKFTNCRLIRGGALVDGDVWVSSRTGKIVRSQVAFYDGNILPDHTVDLGGRILCPGLIECQLNGAFGFNFSTLLDDMSQYPKRLRDLNRNLVRTGVTSYVPTVTSQTSDLYKKVLPFLGPSGSHQVAEDGAESLGAHIEGPFLNPSKNGVHNVSVLREAHSFADLEDMYGAENINPEAASAAAAAKAATTTVAGSNGHSNGDDSNGNGNGDGNGNGNGTLRPIPVRMITAAPELGQMARLIPELTARGIIYSVGHSEATYEEASAAVGAGATMITHLFNAMRPLHHRNPGIFGVLGEAESLPRPFFGVIADGIHLHPTTVKIAHNAHPDGFILVTDAMHMVGQPDGAYRWTNGDVYNNIIKNGNVLLLEGSETIAGSAITLIECITNFLNWTGASVPEALKTVTATPAAMLGLQGVKGTLDAGADADLVVLSEHQRDGWTSLVVDEVWKFGTRVA